jgi:hypothetical protein
MSGYADDGVARSANLLQLGAMEEALHARPGEEEVVLRLDDAEWLRDLLAAIRQGEDVRDRFYDPAPVGRPTSEDGFAVALHAAALHKCYPRQPDFVKALLLKAWRYTPKQIRDRVRDFSKPAAAWVEAHPLPEVFTLVAGLRRGFAAEIRRRPARDLIEKAPVKS